MREKSYSEGCVSGETLGGPCGAAASWFDMLVSALGPWMAWLCELSTRYLVPDALVFRPFGRLLMGENGPEAPWVHGTHPRRSA